MIACGKKKEVEVIPPYKIVVVRTCILKFLHSDPPVHTTYSIASHIPYCHSNVGEGCSWVSRAQIHLLIINKRLALLQQSGTCCKLNISYGVGEQCFPHACARRELVEIATKITLCRCTKLSSTYFSSTNTPCPDAKIVLRPITLHRLLDVTIRTLDFLVIFEHTLYNTLVISSFSMNGCANEHILYLWTYNHFEAFVIL
jgi:hypothetical protein